MAELGLQNFAVDALLVELAHTTTTVVAAFGLEVLVIQAYLLAVMAGNVAAGAFNTTAENIRYILSDGYTRTRSMFSWGLHRVPMPLQRPIEPGTPTVIPYKIHGPEPFTLFYDATVTETCTSVIHSTSWRHAMAVTTKTITSYETIKTPGSSQDDCGPIELGYELSDGTWKRIQRYDAAAYMSSLLCLFVVIVLLIRDCCLRRRLRKQSREERKRMERMEVVEQFMAQHMNRGENENIEGLVEDPKPPQPTVDGESGDLPAAGTPVSGPEAYTGVLQTTREADQPEKETTQEDVERGQEEVKHTDRAQQRGIEEEEERRRSDYAEGRRQEEQKQWLKSEHKPQHRNNSMKTGGASEDQQLEDSSVIYESGDENTTGEPVVDQNATPSPTTDFEQEELEMPDEPSTSSLHAMSQEGPADEAGSREKEHDNESRSQVEAAANGIPIPEEAGASVTEASKHEGWAVVKRPIIIDIRRLLHNLMRAYIEINSANSDEEGTELPRYSESLHTPQHARFVVNKIGCIVDARPTEAAKLRRAEALAETRRENEECASRAAEIRHRRAEKWATKISKKDRNEELVRLCAPKQPGTSTVEHGNCLKDRHASIEEQKKPGKVLAKARAAVRTRQELQTSAAIIETKYLRDLAQKDNKTEWTDYNGPSRKQLRLQKMAYEARLAAGAASPAPPAPPPAAPATLPSPSPATLPPPPPATLPPPPPATLPPPPAVTLPPRTEPEVELETSQPGVAEMPPVTTPTEQQPGAPAGVAKMPPVTMTEQQTSAPGLEASRWADRGGGLRGRGGRGGFNDRGGQGVGRSRGGVDRGRRGGGRGGDRGGFDRGGRGGSGRGSFDRGGRGSGQGDGRGRGGRGAHTNRGGFGN